MRAIFVILFFINSVFAETISEPFKSVKASANVLNTTFIDDKLYIATDGGTVEIYDIKDEKFDEIIKFEDVKSYVSDHERPKILSVDQLNGKILMLSEADFGARILYLKTKDGLKPYKMKNQAVKKALFLNDNIVVLGSISNEIYFMRLSDGEIFESFKISTAMLSDMEFSKDRSTLAIGCESGKVYFYDVAGKTMRKILDIHTDNIYDISYKNGTLITGGTDRIVGIFSDDTLKKIDTGFLVYGVGLSSDGKIGAYMSDEMSDVSLVDMRSLKNIAILKTGQSTINSIIFINENEVITSAYEKNLLFWRIK
ncbi:MAG: nitrate reductase [Campylobacter sp.]|nr:nitrate reductase [Campylobacter sp.]